MVTFLPHLLAGLDALRQTATALLDSIVARRQAELPRALRADPARARARIAGALEWIAALARTLAGETLFLPQPRYIHPPFPGRYPSLTNAIRASCGLPLNPPSTPAQQAARRLRYMRHVFATQPVGVIAARIARRLAIRRTDPAWPADLVAVADPPARLVRPPPPPLSTQAPSPWHQAPPPAFHKRE